MYKSDFYQSSITLVGFISVLVEKSGEISKNWVKNHPGQHLEKATKNNVLLASWLM